MNKLLTAFFSLLGLATVIACKNKHTYPTAANGKSLLWEISGNGLQKPSYFFGTMHLMCAEDAELSQNIKKLIAEVNQVYLEVDMDNAGELLSGMIGLADNDDQRLDQVLSNEDYHKVRSFFERFQPQVPFSVLEKQPPLMISSSLYELLLPCEQKNGVEMKIVEEAYKVKKETKGLETIAFQVNIFNSIPYAEQANDLVKTLDSLESYHASMNEMMKAYKEQDIERLYKLGSTDDSVTTSHLDILLYNRNENWVNKFPAITKDSSTLFAVGAAHLGGKKGVLSLLKQRGFTIRPLIN